MDCKRTDGVTRRHALRRTAAIGLGATIVLAARTPARAETTKLAKEAVKYVDKGEVPGKDCDDCIHYIAPTTPQGTASCRIVEGPISPHGHCLAFTPRTKA